MAGLCIPKSITEKLKTAIKSGDINIEKLYGMTDAERNTVFSHYVGKDSASLVNAVYEKAKLVAEKKAAADYVTTSDKGMFAQKATGGEFGKTLLSDEQTQKLAAAKLDERIKANQAQQKTVSDKLATATGEMKANLQLKLDKLQDIEARFNVRKEEVLNPTTDRLLNKVNGLKTLLSNVDYHDLVSAKMGQDVSPAQGKYIVAQATKLRELARTNVNATFGYSEQYLRTSANLDTYINNLNPLSSWRTVLRDILDTGRNFLLMNPSTPIKMVENQTVLTAINKVTARLGASNIKGVSGDLVKSAYKEAQSYGKNSNYKINALQMTSPNEMGMLGEGQNFEVPKGATSESPIVRVVEATAHLANKYSTKVAIEWEHQILFTKFYQHAALDMMNLTATNLAKGEGLGAAELKPRADAIFQDALKIEPKTDAGKVTRMRAQEHAAFITSTNKTWLGSRLLDVKTGLNKSLPGLGDILGVIVKIPANLIANSIKAAGPGIPMGVYDIWKGRTLLQSADLATQYEGMAKIANGIQTATRTAGALGAAYLLTSQLTNKDFRQDQYGNQFVNIDGVWVNKEYFNIIAPAVGGMMAIRQNYNPNQSSVAPLEQYTYGAVQGLRSLPIVGDLNTAITDFTTSGGKNISSYFMNLLKTRGTPAFINSLNNTRPADRLLFGSTGIETDAQYKADNVAKARKAAEARKKK